MIMFTTLESGYWMLLLRVASLKSACWFGNNVSVAGGRGSYMCSFAPRRWMLDTEDYNSSSVLCSHAHTHTTACSLSLSSSLSHTHLSTPGDMLREAVKNETPVGMKAKGFMDEVISIW